MPSLFTKIINGEIPSYKVYEDDFTFAFLDINPIHPGHTLVVPKTEVDYFIDVPEPYYSAVFKTGKILARAIQDITKCKRVGTVIQGFEVPHFHYHLVPMWDHDDLNFSKGRKLPAQEMKAMQEAIVKKIGKA